MITQLKNTGFDIVASVFDVLGEFLNVFSFEIIVDVLLCKIVCFVIQNNLVFFRFVFDGNQYFSRVAIRDFNALLSAFINKAARGTLKTCVITYFWQLYK